VAPRGYTLRRRAETAAVTRRRILDAAVDLYRELGVPATTLTAVASRANVVRGTIVHHFGSSDGLLGAVLDDVLDRLEVPDERILNGIEDRDRRIRTFVDAMIAFQERSQPYWTMFEGEMQRPELQKREAYYWAAFDRLLAAAVGPELAQDARAGAALMSLSHPSTAGTFFWAFERTGRTKSEARELIADLAIDAVRRIGNQAGRDGVG
jgi:AcrR family transcriptional regulator